MSAESNGDMTTAELARVVAHDLANIRLLLDAGLHGWEEICMHESRRDLETSARHLAELSTKLECLCGGRPVPEVELDLVHVIREAATARRVPAVIVDRPTMRMAAKLFSMVMSCPAFGGMSDSSQTMDNSLSVRVMQNRRGEDAPAR
jgi:hypothetical protein